MPNLTTQSSVSTATPSFSKRLHIFGRLAVALVAAITVTVAAMSAANAAPGDAVASDFPYANPYLATVTVRLMHVTRAAPKVLIMPAIAGRDNVPLFAGRQGLEVAVYTQPRPAPLMYVIPGMGGTALDGAPQFVAEKFYMAGFNVILVPSPFYWKFVLSQSTSALPGYTPDDIKDLTRLMLAVRTQAERGGMQPTRQAVAGYSLGAIQAAYLMKSEQTKPVLGLERAVLINPPLALGHSIGVLDQLNAVGDQWTLSQRNLLWGSVIDAGSGLLNRNINDPSYFLGLDQALPLSNDQLKYLIGNTFRQSLSEAIFVSQQIKDLGILKLPATDHQRSAREDEATRFDFNTYMNEAVLPQLRLQHGAGFSTAQLIAQGDLSSIRSTVVSNSAYYMIHNQDDFLDLPSDLHSWVRAMGPRAVLFPHGGHVGNMWSPDFCAQLIRDVSDLKN